MELFRRRHGVGCGGLVFLGMQARLCDKPGTRDRPAHSAGAPRMRLERCVNVNIGDLCKARLRSVWPRSHTTGFEVTFPAPWLCGFADSGEVKRACPVLRNIPPQPGCGTMGSIRDCNLNSSVHMYSISDVQTLSLRLAPCVEDDHGLQLVSTILSNLDGFLAQPCIYILTYSL